MLTPTRVIVKLGTSTLTNGGENLSLPRMVDLARQISELQAAGHQIALVTSGAIATGREQLNYPSLPKSIPAKQMLSAVGQPRLMQRWATVFEIYNCTVAQILLTAHDLTSRRRYINAQSTLLALLERGILPLINENDTIATQEIRVGDNDNLSAHIAGLIDADLLILLTDQPGLFTANPRTNPNAALIPQVDTPTIPPELWQAAGQGGKLGTGGMYTKLQAAELARRTGSAVIIAQGSLPNVLPRLLAGEPIGTRFSPLVNAIESRKRYILSGVGLGRLTVDAGAVRALQAGRSLLPAGLTAISGEFERGDTVRILTPTGDELARGIVTYPATDCQRLIGLQSSAIESTLGYFYGEEIIHRSNLVLL